MFFKRNHYKNGANKLPRSVYEYMMHRFILLPEHLDTLRCFDYDGLVNEKVVDRLRIFSPGQAKERHLVIKTKSDLDQHPELILFEGHIDQLGKAYVADRRPSSRTLTTKTR